jgi:hypothetical protein
MYADNYYALGRLLGSSPEKVWGILYGELFMNINRDTSSAKRKEFSKLIFDTYQAGFKSGFSRAFNVNVPQTNEKIRLPFAATFEKAIFRCSDDVLKDNPALSLKLINDIRTSFLKKWFDNKADAEFPCMIFDWQNTIYEAGHFEAYNYWLFQYGNEEEFKTWKTENSEKWDNFITWIEENGLQISMQNLFLKKSLQ